MTTQKRVLASPTSPSPVRLRTHSPALSAVRPFPLSSGSLTFRLATPSPFRSPPSLSFIESEPRSPDLFEPFEYTPNMDNNLQRIDSEASDELEINEGTLASSTADVLVPESPRRIRNGKTWVVFYGSTPGMYSD